MFESNSKITKSNHLIEASYKLTAGEQKLILYLISMIDPLTEANFKCYRIKAKNFAAILGVKNNRIYEDLDKIIDNLLKKVVYIKIPDQDIILKASWLASAEYFHGEGEIEIELSSKLKPYLLQLKKYFTSYQLKNILKLNSSYSIRIYELLKQYENIGKRTMDIDELKNILMIDKDKYKRFYDFRKKVIDKAQTELKEKTDIRFDYETIKRGRKIEKIKFVIHKNIDQTDVINNNSTLKKPNKKDKYRDLYLNWGG